MMNMSRKEIMRTFQVEIEAEVERRVKLKLTPLLVEFGQDALKVDNLDLRSHEIITLVTAGIREQKLILKTARAEWRKLNKRMEEHSQLVLELIKKNK